MLTKEEYLDIIEFIQFFYVQNFEATAQIRSLKTERLQIEDENNLSNKLSLLSEIIDKYFELEKALDKACAELENLSYVKGLGQLGKNYSEWKEWCMKDE